ncbi:MAG: hypothetical protein KM310_09535 [Clostridiales bacterium]|nr:hypothetical protein [Clostridiales bacterium]
MGEAGYRVLWWNEGGNRSHLAVPFSDAEAFLRQRFLLIGLAVEGRPRR